MKTLPIPQYEFGGQGFDSFKLTGEQTSDGEAQARRQAELERAKAKAEQEQGGLAFVRPGTPVHERLTLKSGRIVEFRRMANGAQDASMADGCPMSDAEWEELCDLLRRSNHEN